MAVYSKQTWDQLKNTTSADLIKALKGDGFTLFDRRSNIQLYIHKDGRRATIHWHPKKTYGRGLLKALIEDVGWITDKDLRRVGLIK